MGGVSLCHARNWVCPPEAKGRSLSFYFDHLFGSSVGSDVGTGALCPQERGRQSPWSGAAVRRAWVLQRGDGRRQICWTLSRLRGLSLVSRWWDVVGARCPGGLDGSSSGCGVNGCVLSGLIHPGVVGMEEQVSWRRRRWSQAEIISFLGFCSCWQSFRGHLFVQKTLSAYCVPVIFIF